jgi:hypothetical protein
VPAYEFKSQHHLKTRKDVTGHYVAMKTYVTVEHLTTAIQWRQMCGEYFKNVKRKKECKIAN